MTRIQQDVRLYRLDLRLGLGTRLCSENAVVLLSSIYDAHLESVLMHPRDPYVIDRKYPSLDLLQFLNMRFSVDHMNRG